MSSSVSGKGLLQERTVEPGVFEEMDSEFELTDSEKFALSIRFQFPKFSKGFTTSDFEPFINDHIGIDNVVSLGRLCFPNEWQMQVNNKEIREKLIRLGRTKINTRTCWIHPLSPSEVRGFVHWIPNAIQNSFIEETLTPFGEVVFVENQKTAKWTKVDSDSKYFALNLKPGQVVDDIPHFVKICDHTGLITIKGRNPCCFHCREVGHRKSECKKFREKLSDYSSRKPNGIKKRIKPRGRRHRPEQVAALLAADAVTSQGAKPKTTLNQTTTKGKKKKNKVNKTDKIEANKLEATTNVETNKSEGTVSVANNNKMAKKADVSEENVNSVAKVLDLVKIHELVSCDEQIKKKLAVLEDLNSLINGQGSSLRNDLNNFREKWYPEEAAAKDVISPTGATGTTIKNEISSVDVAGVPVMNDISPVEVAGVPAQNLISAVGDAQKDNPALVSEGKKKKKKKKKKNKSEQ